MSVFLSMFSVEGKTPAYDRGRLFCSSIHSLASRAAFMRLSRSRDPNENPFFQLPFSSRKGREKVAEKNRPSFPLFCQIVALMLPERMVVAGFEVAMFFPPFVVKLKLALSTKPESQKKTKKRRMAVKRLAFSGKQTE